MASLTREQIKEAAAKAADTKMKEIDVPRWGGSIFLKVMSVGERDRYENEWQHSNNRGMADFSTKFLVSCVCDSDGKLMFKQADIDWLKTEPADLMRMLWNEAMALNKLQSEDIEELAKN
jgi:hypothetical protein